MNYSNGAFSLGLVVSYLNETSWFWDEPFESEDEYTMNIGASYDFGVAKVKFGGQYYWRANEVGAFRGLGLSSFYDYDGYAVTIGADMSAFGGVLTIGGGYAEGESKLDYQSDYAIEYKGYDVATYYQYPISKQTKVYAGVGYEKLEVESGGLWSEKDEYKAIKAIMGMAHYF